MKPVQVGPGFYLGDVHFILLTEPDTTHGE